MTDMTTATAPPIAARTKAKPRRAKPIERFPLKFHFAVSVAMGESLKRLTGSNSLLSESDIGRLALHAYLLTNDRQYARTMQGSANA